MFKELHPIRTFCVVRQANYIDMAPATLIVRVGNVLQHVLYLFPRIC